MNEIPEEGMETDERKILKLNWILNKCRLSIRGIGLIQLRMVIIGQSS